jgi:hypothetical protein
MEEMDKYCLEFMNSGLDGKQVDSNIKLKFIISINDCHSKGYYLTFNGKWKLSNKKIESLNRQMNNLMGMLNTLFVKID